MVGDENPYGELKSQWNAILDRILEQDRIAWLAFFDARLVALKDNVLTLNFADSEKFGGGHDFKIARNPKHTEILRSAIRDITNLDLTINEE